ncbi:MAG: DNA-3-methyladenine glycosylase 2 family protein [Ignavibacteriae bacterium]|nr:DNA-3-methyladenine glycosylase 2 family protein [Ignavibacteriota bacterium]NOG99885.1 DNA-3-methyladenine glycosylase 2 family protein [Ignavibacteriota bacterium]
MKTAITLPREFNWNECLTFLGRSANECLHIVENSKLRKLLRVNNDLLLLEISAVNNKLEIEYLNFCSNNQVCKTAKEYVIEWLDLQTNLKPFYSFASKNSLMKPLTEKYFGLRLIGIPELFEALCWAIIGQHINLPFAYTLKKKFVETFGEKVIYEGNDYWLFPSPEEILNVSVDDLMKLQFTGKKSEYIIELAYKMNNDELPDKEELKNMSYTGAKESLLKIRGVGEWTADYVLMKCLRFPEALPIADVGLHNAIKNNLKLESKPDKNKLNQITAEWGNWKAYSVFYLWRSLYD